MSAKRYHHKQPNFYLKGFKSSDEGNPKVWVYEKGKPFYDGKTEQLQNPKHLTTEKAAREKDFYAFEKEDGTKEYDKYEDLLMKEFEQPADSAIEKIRNFEEINSHEKAILSKYVASMRTRGEWWKNTYLERVIPATENDVENWNPQEYSRKEIEEARSYSKEMLHTTKDWIHKESIVKIAEKHASEFNKRNWHFLKSPNQLKFFTGDNPVVFINNLFSKPSQIIFPFSSEITLIIIQDGYTVPKSWKRLTKNYWEIDQKSVENIRNDIAFVAIKEVYYSQKAEWLVRFINKFT